PCPLRLLLAPDADGLLGTLAGPGVGVGPLPPDRQAPAVAEPLIGPDLDLALDVLGDVAAEVALHLEVAVDVVADPHDLLVGEVADLAAAVEAQVADDAAGAGRADAVD